PRRRRSTPCASASPPSSRNTPRRSAPIWSSRRGRRWPRPLSKDPAAMRGSPHRSSGTIPDASAVLRGGAFVCRAGGTPVGTGNVLTGGWPGRHRVSGGAGVGNLRRAFAGEETALDIPYRTRRMLHFGDCDISGTAYFPSYLNILN